MRAALVDHVSACAATATAVVETITSCDMAARVPACPGWSTYDVIVHLGNVHAWAATIVETGQQAPEQNDEPRSRRPRAVARWYAGKAEDLLEVLRSARPDDPCWTFSACHHTREFWPRRQTHETVVHLADLRQACGRAPEIPPELATDGIDEVLEVFLPRLHARGRRARLTAPVVLHATDTGAAWVLTPAERPGEGSGEGSEGEPAGASGGAPEVRRATWEDVAGSEMDTVAAPASDLMLLLWKRLPLDSAGVGLHGDRERLLAFLGSPLTP